MTYNQGCLRAACSWQNMSYFKQGQANVLYAFWGSIFSLPADKITLSPLNCDAVGLQLVTNLLRYVTMRKR